MSATRAGLPRYLLAIGLVALSGAAFAVLFRWGSHEAVRRLFGAPNILEAFRGFSPALRLLVPAAGGLLAGLFGVLAARRAGGHGVSEILEAVALGRGQPSISTALWKGLGSFVAILSGGSIGREGPIIQLGAGAASLFGRRLAVGAPRVRALVAAGAAAGFAAAYNTPIAAVLFVVEVVTGVVALEVLLPSAAAAALSTFVTRWAVGGGPLYGGRDFELGASADLALCLVLGVLAGLAGSAFMAMLSAGEGLAKRVALPRPLRGALGGLIVGALALFLPEVCGNGFEANQAILDGAVGAGLVAVLLIAKPLATAATVAGGSPGGVFTPSLFVGAALGGLFGAAAEHLPGGAAGGYAIIGMAAVISATTHAPLMAAVLLFEMSGDYALVLPLLLASAAAAVTARGIRPDSIYTEELRRRGIPWRGNLAERLARAVQARDILQMDPPQIAPSRPLDEALALLERSRSRVVYVVGDGAVRALTLYTARDIFAARARGEAVPAKTAGEAAQPVELASPDDTLLALSEKLWRVDFGELPVVEPGPPPALLGVVTRRDVLGAFDREVLQRDVLLTRVVWFEGQREEADYLELPPGQRVELIAPPAWLVGAAPDPDEIRRRFKVSLLAVRRGGEPTLAEPGSDKPLDGGDRLLVVGEPRAIEALRRSEAPPL